MVYMTWLIKAIMEGKNAVLESATGTGKTAMMVAVISGWMKHTANAKIETRLNAELSSQLEKNANQVSKVFHPSLSVISPTCRKHTIQILSSICHKTQLGGCFDIKTQLIPHKATNKVHNSITNSWSTWASVEWDEKTQPHNNFSTASGIKKTLLWRWQPLQAW